MRCELVGADSPLWTSVLARTDHDLYHLPGYTQSTARLQGGRAIGLIVNDGSRVLLQPLVMRDLAGPIRDATSPYGYAGPLTAGSRDTAFLSDALRAAAGFLAREGVVSLFVRFHPLINEVPHDLETVAEDGETVSIDLSLPEDEARRQLRANHRRQIDRARRAGHRFVMDPGPAYEQTFRRLYRRTMVRIGADRFYHFDDRYFSDLRRLFGSQMHIAVVEIGQSVAAAALFLEGHDIVNYHLSGWDERFRREVPTKLLIDEARRWAARRGHRWLHLGGGYGYANDSLLRFKTGFSSIRTPVHSLRMILRPDDYQMLVRARGGTAGGTMASDYFPAYRRPPKAPPSVTMEPVASWYRDA